MNTCAYIKNCINVNSALMIYRSSHRRCSAKKVFLEILQNSQENTCARVSFLIKLQASGLLLLLFRANTDL